MTDAQKDYEARRQRLASLDDEDLYDDAPQPAPKRTGTNWGLLIGIVVAFAAIAFIVFDGLEAETYFFSVDQAVEKGEGIYGKHVRIKGVVEAGTIDGTAGVLGHSFKISEQGVSMPVVYSKALPDTFQEGVEVVAHGRLDDQGTLHADEILVKCPSRYEGQPPTALDPQASL